MSETFRLPAEWEAQGAVQLTWPHPRGDWEDNLDPAQHCFARIGAALSMDQTLLCVVLDEAHEQRVRSLLREQGAVLANCRFFRVPSEDSWARDHGPLTVSGADGWSLLDFEFNGWGGRHPARQDNAITTRLAELGAFGDTPLQRPGLTLEGGAIDTDGRGGFLIRQPTLVDARRNPGMNREEIERALGHWLGARRIHWLHSGDLAGDDTDGHIDTLARFAPDNRILHQDCDDPRDPHYEPLKRMARELAEFRDADDKAPERIALPLPAPVRDREGNRTPAGYANFLVTPRRVLMPAYKDPADAVAARRIAAAFSGREVVPIDCRALVRQGGSLHCVTMQYPPGVVAAHRTDGA